jgi:hypothetical protein
MQVDHAGARLLRFKRCVSDLRRCNWKVRVLPVELIPASYRASENYVPLRHVLIYFLFLSQLSACGTLKCWFVKTTATSLIVR